MTVKKARNRIFMRVTKGALVPADRFSSAKLRERGLKVDDIVAADISKPRNPRFWRLAHYFGEMVAEHIEDFEGMEAHRVLKKIQLEADIFCDHMLIKIPGLGVVEQRIPDSLSFDSMDELEFKAVFRQFADHIAKRYWLDSTPEQIEKIALSMPTQDAA